ncbi:DUF7660 family protein [Rossellomorea vietnamensis]|uniref:DUF7660 family protein n=1 Tax=Rossellomorea vietnamensis TaxID=218284 RepID=UPI001E42273C|nr:hypothetical protein [Rossellomorea vietnamensis]MCC5801852.1 hypothetical protein [Rossellomorea vietnamensis]
MNFVKVNNKEELISFLYNLKLDLINNEEQWENVTLSDYLDAINAWLQDEESLPTEPGWELIAAILLSGKYYE